MPIFIFFGSIVTVILFWVIRLQLKQSRLNQLFLTPLPTDWIQILKNNVSIYSLLPEDLKNELHGRINIFLDGKEFIGCADIQITNEIKITIAGNACLLLLKRDKCCFPGFTTILIYPDTFVSKEIKNDGLLEIQVNSVRAGESWFRGPVVLSWADVLRGSLDNSNGNNVVLHEFAHKLDEQNAIMNGLPVLRDRSHYAEWAEVLSKEFESLLIRVDRGTNSVIDTYGTSSPVEFFAVVTESFFEKPLQMKHKLPKLYQQFKLYYNLDPAVWRNTS